MRTMRLSVEYIQKYARILSFNALIDEIILSHYKEINYANQ